MEERADPSKKPGPLVANELRMGWWGWVMISTVLCIFRNSLPNLLYFVARGINIIDAAGRFLYFAFDEGLIEIG